MATNIEHTDIQGLLIRGYGKLKGCLYALLKIEDGKLAKTYLHDLAGRLNTCSTSPDDEALNMAITSDGLRKLELSPDVLATFPREYLEGLNDDVRKVLLGDLGENDPSNWKWGGDRDPKKVDVLLMIYGANQDMADSVYQREKDQFSQHGIAEALVQKGVLLPKAKEHFGFHDGISRPAIAGMHPKGAEFAYEPLKTGEFVLGYENEYGSYSEGPAVPKEEYPNAELPVSEANSSQYDLGKNGSFLVYRQMTQDVPSFWNYLSSQGKDDSEAIKIGSKMVGRWPSGTALRISPDHDDPDPKKVKRNDFLYWDNDKQGLECPYGAHIRRANPRDWLYTEKSSKVASEMVRKHAILRRARSFGEPLTPEMKTEDMIAESKRQEGEPDKGERGLHFIALVGHINRQFEFIQNAWIKSPAFAGMTDETDPIIGPRHLPHNPPNADFTCPAHPIRKKYHGLPEFTKIVGGAYFFLPGIKALKFLTS